GPGEYCRSAADRATCLRDLEDLTESLPDAADSPHLAYRLALERRQSDSSEERTAALAGFQRFLALWPNHVRSADAMASLVAILREEGRIEEWRETLAQFKDKYPDRLAQIARLTRHVEDGSPRPPREASKAPEDQ